jgi:peptidoglycan/xylan/chitin deacetylase (PgdA/CDA1 family)
MSESRPSRLATLEYHDVVGHGGADATGFPGPSAGSYKLTRADFATHLEKLRPLAVARLGCDGAATFGDDAVVLTFDDGGIDAIRVAAPMLEEFGMRGIFFMTTGMMGRAGFLGADDLRELHARGHGVGTHSVSHPPRFSVLPPTEMNRELAESRDALEQVLCTAVHIGSVPGGYFSRAVAEAAAAQRYRWLFTSEPTSRLWTLDGCVVAGRFTLRAGDSADRAWSFATGRGSAQRRAAMGWQAKKVLKAVAGPAYVPLRRMIFGDDRASAAPAKGRE